MRNLFPFLLVILFAIQAFPQKEYLDILNERSPYNTASKEVRNSKAFSRERAFFDERAYPDGVIPQDAYSNAMVQKEKLRSSNAGKESQIIWVSLGPTPGAYFSYGNISSRIVTAVYHPQNPQIIYIGPANGGIWKTIDGGLNWFPTSDNEASLSMGALAIDRSNPEIIYAGTGEATYSGASYYGRGLLKSTNGGTSWQQITNGFAASTYFSRIVIHPTRSNELLAAMGNNGLMRSTDAGITWNSVLFGRCDDVLYSLTGDTVFALGSGIGGIRRSTDSGVNFSAFSSGLPSMSRAHFDYCLTSPNVFYCAIYYSTTTAVTVYKSTDYAVTWTQAAIGTDFSGSQAWYDLHCKVDPKNPGYAYVGTIDLWRTMDGGTTFTNITNGYSNGTVHVDQHNVVFHPSAAGTFLCLNDGGVWRSTDNGNSFTNLNKSLTLTQFYRIAASPFNPSRILGGTQDNGTQQTYSSLSWEGAFGGDGGEVCFNPFDSLYIIGETQNNGMRRTTNGGASWVSAVSGISSSETPAWVAPILHHPTQSGIFYTGRQKVYKSTNNGGSWTAISANLSSTAAIREMAISASRPELMYASTGSTIYRSLDGGATWSNITVGLPSKTISSIYVHPTNSEIAIVTYLGFGGSKIYKTTDTGASWASINGNLPDSPVSDGLIYTADTFYPNTYFVASDIGVFYTRDNGVSWIETFDGLPNTVIKHLDYSPKRKALRAGTHGRGVYEAFIDFILPVELKLFTADFENGVIALRWATATETNNRGFEIERKLKGGDWVRLGFVAGKGTSPVQHNYSFSDDRISGYTGTVLYRLKQVDLDGKYEYSTIASAEVRAATHFLLQQNYPNPAGAAINNGITVIKYSVNKDGHVDLSLFNVMGEKVRTLSDGWQSAGEYHVVLNTNDLPSGNYFYRLQDSNGQVNRKLTVIR